jgi:pimeloyl-ACP methyl ester carboxylesterase
LAFNLSKYQSDSLSIGRWTWNMVQAMATTDAEGFWKKYTKPVMFIAAEKDELFNLEECRRQHRKASAGGPFVVIENTSHLGLGFSDKVCETLSKWFSDPDSSSNGIS